MTTSLASTQLNFESYPTASFQAQEETKPFDRLDMCNGLINNLTFHYIGFLLQIGRLIERCFLVGFSSLKALASLASPIANLILEERIALPGLYSSFTDLAYQITQVFSNTLEFFFRSFVMGVVKSLPFVVGILHPGLGAAAYKDLTSLEEGVEKGITYITGGKRKEDPYSMGLHNKIFLEKALSKRELFIFDFPQLLLETRREASLPIK